MGGNSGVFFQEEQISDLDELRDFFNQAFNELPEKDLFPEELDQSDISEWFALEHLPHYLNKHGFMITVRNDRGGLVGAIAVGKQHPLTWPDGKKVEIFILAVGSQHRGRGIGGALLDKALERAKGMGAKKVIVNSHILLEVSHRFYENHGFTQMGVLKNYYENGDAVFFGKDL